METTELNQGWENGVRKSVEVNGITWHYLEYGNPEGQPILNIHGWLGASAEGNDKLSRAFTGEIQNSLGLQQLVQHDQASADKLSNRLNNLKGKYHIITPELPGFGTTEPLPDEKSLDKIADEMAEFQKVTNTENSLVFGSSMGGILAIKLAARHPETVKSIAIEGTMTRPKDMDKVAYLGAQLATWGPIKELLDKANLLKPLFAKIVEGSKDFQIAPPETQERVRTKTFLADKQTVSTTLREIGQDLQEDIDKVTCPVIIIDGANGELVPIMKSHNITRRFPTDQAIFIPIGGYAGEHGHNIVDSFPEGLAAWVDYINSK